MVKRALFLNTSVSGLTSSTCALWSGCIIKKDFGGNVLKHCIGSLELCSALVLYAEHPPGIARTRFPSPTKNSTHRCGIFCTIERCNQHCNFMAVPVLSLAPTFYCEAIPTRVEGLRSTSWSTAGSHKASIRPSSTTGLRFHMNQLPYNTLW